MPKSYLITLDKTDLQSIIFETVDRAIKINRIPNQSHVHNPRQATKTENPSLIEETSQIKKANEKEAVHG